jgi:hypothetical protein
MGAPGSCASAFFVWQNLGRFFASLRMTDASGTACQNLTFRIASAGSDKLHLKPCKT